MCKSRTKRQNGNGQGAQTGRQERLSPEYRHVLEGVGVVEEWKGLKYSILLGISSAERYEVTSKTVVSARRSAI